MSGIAAGERCPGSIRIRGIAISTRNGGLGCYSTNTVSVTPLMLESMGALGGPLPLFQGSTQMAKFVGRAGEFTAWQSLAVHWEPLPAVPRN